MGLDLTVTLGSLSLFHWNPNKWLCDRFQIPQKFPPDNHEQFTLPQKTQFARICLVEILEAPTAEQKDLFNKEIADRLASTTE
jgi:hypothetical protein